MSTKSNSKYSNLIKILKKLLLGIYYRLTVKIWCRNYQISNVDQVRWPWTRKFPAVTQNEFEYDKILLHHNLINGKCVLAKIKTVSELQIEFFLSHIYTLTRLINDGLWVQLAPEDTDTSRTNGATRTYTPQMTSFSHLTLIKIKLFGGSVRTGNDDKNQATLSTVYCRLRSTLPSYSYLSFKNNNKLARAK